MITVGVRNQNGMNVAPQPRIAAAGHGVGGIVQKAYSRRVFKQNRSITCTELARPLADRRDFDVLGLRQIRARYQCDYQTERLPSHFHCPNPPVFEISLDSADEKDNIAEERRPTRI